MGVGVYALLGHHISLTLMWCYYACGVGHASGMGWGWCSTPVGDRFPHKV